MTTSHSPDRMSRSASWKAMTPLAQAATWVMTGPVRPYFMLTSAAAIDPDSAGIANGLTWPGPLSGEGGRPFDDLLHAPAAGVDDDRRPIAPLDRPVAEVEPGVVDRLGRRGHREVDEPAHPAGHLAVHRDRRIEVLDLGGDADVERRSRRTT